VSEGHTEMMKSNEKNPWAPLNFMLAMLHLNFSEGVCLEVSNEHSWSLGTAVIRGDEGPCPVMHGSALFLSVKNGFFSSSS